DCNLCQVSDAQDLTVASHAPDFLTDYLGGGATDSGIDLIKDVHTRRANVGQHALDRQHSTAQLSAACHASQWTRLLSHVWSDQEFCSVDSLSSQGGSVEFDPTLVPVEWSDFDQYSCVSHPK